MIDLGTIHGPLKPDAIYELFYGELGLGKVMQVEVTPEHCNWVRVGPVCPAGASLFICGKDSSDTRVFPIYRPSQSFQVTSHD